MLILLHFLSEDIAVSLFLHALVVKRHIDHNVSFIYLFVFIFLFQLHKDLMPSCINWYWIIIF